mmetsp:Transcript_115730/g.327276  ORF Transcript_115730/g.327276 Transcript_115730/m.327276 type:complete len:224 (-) Transcript_115730:3-674(-)
MMLEIHLDFATVPIGDSRDGLRLGLGADVDANEISFVRPGVFRQNLRRGCRCQLLSGALHWGLRELRRLAAINVAQLRRELLLVRMRIIIALATVSGDGRPQNRIRGCDLLLNVANADARAVLHALRTKPPLIVQEHFGGVPGPVLEGDGGHGRGIQAQRLVDALPQLLANDGGVDCQTLSSSTLQAQKPQRQGRRRRGGCNFWRGHQHCGCSRFDGKTLGPP